MRMLIVEDDFMCRTLLLRYLRDLGRCEVAINGAEAVAAVSIALDEGERYDVVFLDVMMPEMDGQQALAEIRRAERERGIRPGDGARVVMTTALSDKSNVLRAFNEACDAYLVKPIAREDVMRTLGELGLGEAA